MFPGAKDTLPLAVTRAVMMGSASSAPSRSVASLSVAVPPIHILRLLLLGCPYATLARLLKS
jgi:hypothetical protein